MLNPRPSLLARDQTGTGSSSHDGCRRAYAIDAAASAASQTTDESPCASSCNVAGTPA